MPSHFFFVPSQTSSVSSGLLVTLKRPSTSLCVKSSASSSFLSTQSFPSSRIFLASQNLSHPAITMATMSPVSSPPTKTRPDPTQYIEKYKLPIYDSDKLSPQQHDLLTLRPKIDFSRALNIVQPILNDVKAKGDAALREYTLKFDKVQLDTPVVDVASLPMPDLPPEISSAFDVAYENIRKFHQAQVKPPLVVDVMPGVQCRRLAKPIARVGLYVPGGTAVLPSTALMLAVPAKIAGCQQIVIATPPRADGSLCPEVVYCAKKCGVDKILKCGGAQAVAALAYGTETCPKVDKICGPGNQFVTAAKMVVQNQGEALVAIDMPAGPSEQLCIADESANLAFVISDWLSQAEHGNDSQVVLVAVGKFDVSAFEVELTRQLDQLSRKNYIIENLPKSLILRVPDKEAALRFTNAYAPEHLCIQTSDPEDYADGVTDAGSIFLGPYAPESVGDYASGTNHSLPTYGYAKMYGGVSTDTFQKYITVQRLSAEGLKELGPTVEIMAHVEGLDAHKNAVTIRLDSINKGERF